MVRDISGVVGQATAKKRHIFRLVHRWYDMVWSHVGYDIWSYVWYGIWLLAWYGMVSGHTYGIVSKRDVFFGSSTAVRSAVRSSARMTGGECAQCCAQCCTHCFTAAHCYSLLHISHFISQKSTQRCTFHTTKRSLHTLRLFLKTSNKHKYAQCTKKCYQIAVF